MIESTAMETQSEKVEMNGRLVQDGNGTYGGASASLDASSATPVVIGDRLGLVVVRRC